MTRALTLGDLKRICLEYVPKASRHPGLTGARTHDWWYAHEIGHLLVALPRDVGHEMFGLDLSKSTVANNRWLLLHECATMTVSRKLLIAAGAAKLASTEAEDTDHDTMYWWWDHHRMVKNFVAKRGLARVPRSAAGLEVAVRRKLAQR